jgi:hypothetical protein
MITALVQFRLPNPLSRKEAEEIFSTTAPKYQKIQGLIKKYYLLSEDGLTAGGVYIWKSREEAQALYTKAWRQFILDKYGAAPTLTFFETPVVVDNVSGEIAICG